MVAVNNIRAQSQPQAQQPQVEKQQRHGIGDALGRRFCDCAWIAAHEPPQRFEQTQRILAGDDRYKGDAHPMKVAVNRLSAIRLARRTQHIYGISSLHQCQSFVNQARIILNARIDEFKHLHKFHSPAAFASAAA